MEKILFLACDLERAISSIFEPLLYQIVHWMSKKGATTANKEIFLILDVLIESSTSKQNLKLREISSEAISEYVKWFIKQHSDKTLIESSSSIKYLIRSIESYAQHPDAFKRLGTIMCFDKLLDAIVMTDVYVDKYFIEIASYCILLITYSHQSSDLQELIFSYTTKVMDKQINYTLLFAGKIKPLHRFTVKH